MQTNIKIVTNNKDKQNTYKHLTGKYKKAINSECYFEAMLITYAMLEDRLRSIIYHSGGLKNRAAKRFNSTNSVDIVFRDIISEYKDEKEDDKLQLSTITGKIKIIRCVVKWASQTDKLYTDNFPVLLKSQYESLDAYEMLEKLNDLSDWLVYRNEIIHGLLNKNMDSLYSELATKVRDGMALARYFDAQCKLLKKGNVIRKYLKLQNN